MVSAVIDWNEASFCTILLFQKEFFIKQQLLHLFQELSANVKHRNQRCAAHVTVLTELVKCKVFAAHTSVTLWALEFSLTETAPRFRVTASRMFSITVAFLGAAGSVSPPRTNWGADEIIGNEGTWAGYVLMLVCYYTENMCVIYRFRAIYDSEAPSELCIMKIKRIKTLECLCLLRVCAKIS